MPHTHIHTHTHTHTHTPTGASPDELVAQECGHGNERRLPEAPGEDFSQDLHPAARQRQVGSRSSAPPVPQL